MYLKLPKSIPERIGHNNIPLRLISLKGHIPERFSNHPRLKVFFHKGVKCAHPDCKRHGYYLIKTQDPGGGIHIDLYTVNFVLMTVDHIHPKSKGGSESLENKQPMCEPHNQKKRDHIILSK